MGPNGRPVVLIHGWKSHPGVWKRFIPLLGPASSPAWNFGYDGLGEASLPDLAAALRDFIIEKREAAGYAGEIGMVGHCMGAVIARYMLEVLPGDREDIGAWQLIGLGPPNNGSSIAELFCDPVQGPGMARDLSGSFLPPGCDPTEDRIVHEFRPGSPAMKRLGSAGRCPSTVYRFILTGNPARNPGFFPVFHGLTWRYSMKTGWDQTLQGDGIVPHTDSIIPGAGTEIVPAPEHGGGGDPYQFCHFNLPRNPVIMQQVIRYLQMPAGSGPSPAEGPVPPV